MSFEDQLAADAVNVFGNTDELAEQITYRVYVNQTTYTNKSVNAVVFRKPPARIAESSIGISYEFEVFIPNDADVGVTAIQKGKDKITLADRIGGTPSDRLVAEIIASDAGGWHLGLR